MQVITGKRGLWLGWDARQDFQLWEMMQVVAYLKNVSYLHTVTKVFSNSLALKYGQYFGAFFGGSFLSPNCYPNPSLGQNTGCCVWELVKGSLILVCQVLPME